MKFFTRSEVYLVTGILLFIFTLSFFNYQKALVRARDVQRKSDINRIVAGLGLYHAEFGFYPPATPDGRIAACLKKEAPLVIFEKTDTKEHLLEIFDPCGWGQDALRDVFDEAHPAYLESIPGDPEHLSGDYYFYFSTVDHFQILAALESKEEPEFSVDIKEREISCGRRLCNFGKSTEGVPLSAPLEDYERSLLEKDR